MRTYFFYLIFFLLVFALLFIFGCVESTIPSAPFTASQFVNKTTDLNYTLYLQGYYDKNCLWIDVNKISVIDCNASGAIPVSSLDTNWQTNWTAFDTNIKAQYGLPVTASGLQAVLDVNANATRATMGVINIVGYDFNLNGLKSPFHCDGTMSCDYLSPQAVCLSVGCTWIMGECFGTPTSACTDYNAVGCLVGAPAMSCTWSQDWTHQKTQVDDLNVRGTFTASAGSTPTFRPFYNNDSTLFGTDSNFTWDSQTMVLGGAWASLPAKPVLSLYEPRAGNAYTVLAIRSGATYMCISGTTIAGDCGTNSDSSKLQLNLVGYIFSSTKFRDFQVWNGKGNDTLFYCDGSQSNCGIGTATPNPLFEFDVNGKTLLRNDTNVLANLGVALDINFGRNLIANGSYGIDKNAVVVKDVDLIGLTKTYCDMNYIKGVLVASTC